MYPLTRDHAQEASTMTTAIVAIEEDTVPCPLAFSAIIIITTMSMMILVARPVVGQHIVTVPDPLNRALSKTNQVNLGIAVLVAVISLPMAPLVVATHEIRGW